jgi:hypothetical protein
MRFAGAERLADPGAPEVAGPLVERRQRGGLLPLASLALLFHQPLRPRRRRGLPDCHLGPALGVQGDDLVAVGALPQGRAHPFGERDQRVAGVAALLPERPPQQVRDELGLGLVHGVLSFPAGAEVLRAALRVAISSAMPAG